MSNQPGSEPLCGEFVIDVIAGASWIPCGLPKGHEEQGHRGTGKCTVHGNYLGEIGAFPQCPEWPECIKAANLVAIAPTAAPSPTPESAGQTDEFVTVGRLALIREVLSLRTQLAERTRERDRLREQLRRLLNQVCSYPPGSKEHERLCEHTEFWAALADTAQDGKEGV